MWIVYKPNDVKIMHKESNSYIYITYTKQLMLNIFIKQKCIYLFFNVLSKFQIFCYFSTTR